MWDLTHGEEDVPPPNPEYIEETIFDLQIGRFTQGFAVTPRIDMCSDWSELLVQNITGGDRCPSRLVVQTVPTTP